VFFLYLRRYRGSAYSKLETACPGPSLHVRSCADRTTPTQAEGGARNSAERKAALWGILLPSTDAPGQVLSRLRRCICNTAAYLPFAAGRIKMRRHKSENGAPATRLLLGCGRSKRRGRDKIRALVGRKAAPVGITARGRVGGTCVLMQLQKEYKRTGDYRYRMRL
jgi:hypothetical protein